MEKYGYTFTKKDDTAKTQGGKDLKKKKPKLKKGKKDVNNARDK